MEKIGVTKDHEDILKFTIHNSNGMQAQLMNYGADLLSLFVKDSSGQTRDVVLGYENVEDYFDNSPYFGCTVLPNANRIAQAQFSLNGKTYSLDNNDQGNNLHSGKGASSHKIWDVIFQAENQIIFSIDFKDGELGFPGKRNFTVSYLLTDDNCLCIKYSGISDADSIFNPTNHSYFNLAGAGHGTILDHQLTINANAYTYANPFAICNGELVNVEGTPFDFRVPKTISKDINADNQALKWARGYDHNFVLNKDDDFSLAATLTCIESGITMDIYTEMPGIQIYTGNYVSNSDIGKGNIAYCQNAGVALETQFFPNAINIQDFESPILKANQLTEYETVFKFDVL